MKEVIKTVLSDSGHGWLSVKRKEIVELGISDKISSFSYANGKSVYLEEDCDAGVYIDAQRERGVTVKFKNGKWSERSYVRSFDNYSK